MTWECHNCGEQHDSLPAQCRSCGTAPEIVENVWRCASCGESGIGGTRTSCPSCGAEKGKDAKVAVDPSRKIEGERGRALMSGDWRYCAYCKTQVPPVNQQGIAITLCPTCGGSLDESKEAAARQTISADQAATYRPQQVIGAPVSPPAPAPAPAPPSAPSAPKKSRRRLALYLLGALALLIGMCGYLGYDPLRVQEMRVSGKHWMLSIPVETLHKEQLEGWEKDVPEEAYDKKCEGRKTGARKVFDREEEYFVEVEDRGSCLESAERQIMVDVPDGEESYTDKKQVGKSCARTGFVENGGVSMKKCLEWEAKYEDVTRTRTKYRKEPQIVRDCVRYGTRQDRRTRKLYRQEPILTSYCHYTIDKWLRERFADTEGYDDNPKWAEEPKLGPNERLGERESQYFVILSALPNSTADKSARKHWLCVDKPCEYRCVKEEWETFSVGTTVRAVTQYRSIQRFLKPGEELR